MKCKLCSFRSYGLRIQKIGESFFRRLQSITCPRSVDDSKDPYSGIDRDIAKLVNAMNRSREIRTIGSCQGHPKKQFAPYVYFSSSVETAARIELALTKWGPEGECRLSVPWRLTAQFDHNNQLNFCLFSPTYDGRVNTLIGAVIQFFYRRHQVRRDLCVLTKLIKKTILDKREDIENDKRRR